MKKAMLTLALTCLVSACGITSFDGVNLTVVHQDGGTIAVVDGGAATLSEDAGMPAPDGGAVVVITEDGGSFTPDAGAMPADGGEIIMTADGGAMPPDGGAVIDGGICWSDNRVGWPCTVYVHHYPQGSIPTLGIWLCSPAGELVCVEDLKSNEVCNGIDEDGDGLVDEDTCPSGQICIYRGFWECQVFDAGGLLDGGIITDGGIMDGGIMTDGGVVDGGIYYSENLIIDPGFENGFGGWEFEKLPGHENASFELDTSRFFEGSTSARIGNNVVGDYYAVQLKQHNIPIVAGEKYVLAFCIRVDAARTVRIQVMEDNSPWAEGGLFETLTLETPNVWPCYEFHFVAKHIASNYRVTFHTGDSTIPMNVDKVSLRHYWP